MFPYSFNQILFFFFIYCFMGWIIESTWVSAHQKRFINRGFMRGPFIPIYGFGAITLLLSSAFMLKWPVAVFFSGMFAASVLEYFTGAAMEAIFKVRYWDYSGKKFNINGHVCLFNSLCWGVLSLGENYFVHKPIENLSNILGESGIYYVNLVVSAYFMVDLTLSFKAAFDLRDLIVAMEKAKDELRIMQKRLDVMLAYASADYNEQIDKMQEKISSISENVGGRIEDMAESVEAKMQAIIKAMEEKPAAFADSVKKEYMELQGKFSARKENHFGLNKFTDFYKRGIFLGNPSLKSVKFKDTVESIKAFATDKKNRQER